MADSDKNPRPSPEKRLQEYLDSKSLRKTPERFAILKKALELKAHFGSGDLVKAFDKGDYHISRATIFNTLEILCDSGILRRHLFESNQARYEVAGGNHLHLVCTECGKIKEVNDPEQTHNIMSMEFDRFTPSYFSATIYGTCDACARRKLRSRKTI